jgi:uncharacterized protein (DUF3820 family)
MTAAHDRSGLDVELARLLADLASATMPFGKYGPEHFPPAGVPLVDLPYEYLSWFARTGFPKGRLGVLLQFVHQAKQDGADEMFDPVRAVRGGRVSLRQVPRRQWSFPGNEAAEAEP